MNLGVTNSGIVFLQNLEIFLANSELIHEPERKELLDTARSIVRELELQELVSIRLCMLGISIAILPRKLTRKLTESELSNPKIIH